MFVPLTPLRCLHRAVDLFGSKIGVVCGERQFTYAHLGERCERLATALPKFGIEPGDRVAYLSFNNHQLIEGYYGVIQARAIVMPLNVRLSEPELINILNHSGAKMLLFEDDFAPLVEHLKDTGVAPDKGGLLEVNGSPTDAAAGLIKKGIHEGLEGGGYKTLAEYDTPNWFPSNAQQWVSGQITRFGPQIVGVVAANDGTGGGAIAAFKAAGVNPVPPVTGNDATLAGLQLIIAGDQYNTISKPSEIVGGAAAKVAVDFLNGDKPKAETTLFDTPSQLFVPAVVTAKNLKAEIVDKKLATPAELCSGRYAEGCKKLGITP